MNMKNSLQKRTPVQNLQMAVGTACAMGTAAMMSTVMAYADVSTAIDKVFNVETSYRGCHHRRGCCCSARPDEGC